MNTDTPNSAVSPEESPPAQGQQKPVIIYILILFIVAFLMMALSLLMNQRSHEEALGELQDSIAAMREAQTEQDRVNQMEKQLQEAQEAAAIFQDAAETARNQASHAEYTLERTQEAMDWFWQLNEAYVQGDMERCGDILEEMNADSPLGDYLSEKAAARYAEIFSALGEPSG